MKHKSDKVSQERWTKAQDWERAHWVRTQQLKGKFFKNQIWRVLSALGLREKYRGDDWNDWWKEAFGNYTFLPNSIENAIEVGCGPYTNIRHMLTERNVKHIFLSDPLIRTYMKFKMTFVSEHAGDGMCILDDHSIEDLPYADAYFDAVIMINVLDHVRDAAACMQTLIRILKPGGYLVIGQDLSNDDDLRTMEGEEGEVGHPIKLDHEWFEEFLKIGFDPTLYKVLTREEGRAPTHHYGTLLFAGTKTS